MWMCVNGHLFKRPRQNPGAPCGRCLANNRRREQLRTFAYFFGISQYKFRLRDKAGREAARQIQDRRGA